MIDYKELFKKSKELEKKYHLTHYELLQRFMFERILERISVSRYQDNFILKGGLLLSAMFGIDSRTTKDMDATIKGLDISKEKMLEVLNEILSIDLKDNVKFDLVNVTDIREDDEYGGNKYHLIGRLENLKVLLEIDISTGDIITPRELKFEYPLIFENKKIFINSYNSETILAEKIETILRRGQYNARMKDYYDVYSLLKKYRSNIDIGILKKSLENTVNKRDSKEYLKDYNEILDSILKYDRINTYWKGYIKKNSYADGIQFVEIVKLIRALIKSL